jgi:high-affinity nickel-transport protein
VLLGLYVLGTFFRPSAHNHAPKTRITLLINGILWLYWKLSLLFGGSRVEAPQVFKNGYGTTSTFLVGVVHGLGAETFTQISLFLAVASLGGLAGLLGLLMFILGLLVMNTLMCAAAAGLFSATLAHPSALRALTLVTSAYSIVVGAMFLLGASDRLPTLTSLN